MAFRTAHSMKFVPLLALVFCAPSATAQDVTAQELGPRLQPYRYRVGSECGLGLRVADAEGPAFLWMIRARESETEAFGDWVPLAFELLDIHGCGAARYSLRSTAPRPRDLEHRVLFLRDGRLVASSAVAEGFDEGPAEEPPGELLDFDWGLGGVALPAGLVVSKTQPWWEFLEITADNANAEHPDAALLVDSSAWAEGAGRPRTRGTGALRRGAPGAGDRDLGQVLAIAAHLTDSDGDGLVDGPQVESAGGLLTFHFAGPSRVPLITLFDVDEPGGFLRSFQGDVLIGEEEIPVGEDLSTQTLWIPGGFDLLTRIEVELAGSGAVVDLTLHGCPAIINFDESSTGVPLALEAGQEVNGEYAGLGLFSVLAGTNNDPDHPDLAILFDTSRPSGEDFDLATPGPGIGNDLPRKKILILAENDEDADGDGLVDDPDDERAGGVITFQWITSDVFFRSATVIDVDVDETAFVRIFDQGRDTWVVLPFSSLGDNSVQTVSSRVGPTRVIEFHFSGSGGVVELRICSD